MRVSCDIVLFNVKQGKLHILLVKRATEPYKHMRALPWGFIQDKEDCETCIHRVLYKETKIYTRHIKLSGIQSLPDRDPRERNISIGYYSIISSEELIPMEWNTQSSALFVPITDLPLLSFDHDMIVKNALVTLSWDMEWSDIIKYFLPKHFPLSLLLEYCEIIFRRKFEKRNFLKFISKRFKITKTKYKEKWVTHRPAFLYKFV